MTTAAPVARVASRERATVLWVYLSGIAAGIAVGRFIPVESQVEAAFRLTSTATALLLSAVTAVAACLALPVGSRIKTGDLNVALARGLLILLVTGLIQAAAPSAAVLFAARLLEGVGYLLVTVAGPMVLSASCSPATERRGLALWSTFIPVGIAVGTALGATAGTVGWRVAVSLTTIPGLAALVGVRTRLTDTSADGDGQQRVPRRGVAAAVRLSLAFCLVALLGVTMLSLLPHLAADHRVSSNLSNLTATVVSLLSVPGGLLAGRLMDTGWQPRRLAFGALLIPCAALYVFMADSWWSVAVGAGLLMIGNGLTLAILYASVPTAAPSPPAMAFAYGLLIQAGSLGTLAGPPLFTALDTRIGWGMVVALAAILTLTSLALFRSVVPAPKRSATA